MATPRAGSLVRGVATSPYLLDFANEGVDDPHVHSLMTEIYLVARGTSAVRVGSETIEWQQGDALMLSPARRIPFRAVRRTTYISSCIHLDWRGIHRSARNSRWRTRSLVFRPAAEVAVRVLGCSTGGRSRAQVLADFAVPRNGRRARSIGGPPLRMLRALGDLACSVLSKVTLELLELHATSVRSSGSVRSPATPGSSSSGVSMRRSASMTFSRASSRVRP